MMRVTVQHYNGTVEEFTIPSPAEVKAFKDALRPIAEFLNQDPPAPSFDAEEGFIDVPMPVGCGAGGLNVPDVLQPQDLPCEGLVASGGEMPIIGTPDVEVTCPLCFLCGSMIVGNESYCYGCRVFICENHPQSPWGRHLPYFHDEP